MKIFGIKGEKIWGEDMETQDWTANNYPIRTSNDPVAHRIGRSPLSIS